MKSLEGYLKEVEVGNRRKPVTYVVFSILALIVMVICLMIEGGSLWKNATHAWQEAAMGIATVALFVAVVVALIGFLARYGERERAKDEVRRKESARQLTLRIVGAGLPEPNTTLPD